MRCSASLAPAAVVLLAVGCSSEARLSRHLERGEAHFAAGRWDAASLEFESVLEIDPEHARARRQLGLACVELGRLSRARTHLQVAKRLLSADTEVRLRLGELELVGRQPGQAWAEARFVLQREPENARALVLLAEAAGSPEDVATARELLAAARESGPERSGHHLADGVLRLKEGDLGAAEGAFRAAVDTDAASVEARLALANLYRLLGDAPAAERELRAAAELPGRRSVAALMLADFYLAAGRAADAERVLLEMTGADPGALGAWLALARLYLDRDERARSREAVDQVLGREPSSVPALMLRAELELLEGDAAASAETSREVLRLETGYAPAHHQLGRALLRLGETERARTALRMAAALEPQQVETALLLGELEVKAGDVETAIGRLEPLAGRGPRGAEVRLLLGIAYLRAGRYEAAARSLRAFRSAVPDDPRGPLNLGLALRAMGRDPEAVATLESALDAAPGLIDAVVPLVAIDLARGRTGPALARVRRELRARPDSARLRHLEGVALEAAGARAEAARAYERAAALDAGLAGPRLGLSRLSAAQGALDRAAAHLERAREIDPDNPRLHMTAGGLYQQLGDLERARQAFEEAVRLAPDLVPAANNLAYLYAEHFGRAAAALDLARQARAGAPDDPHVADTLGWVLYRNRRLEEALPLLEESARQIGDSAEVQLHLGVVRRSLGDADGARQALEHALDLDPSPGIAEEARRTLAELDPDAS